MSDYHQTALVEALRHLATCVSLRNVASSVARNRSKLAAQLQGAVLTEVAQLQRSRNPDLLPETNRHGEEHIDEVLRLLGGGEPQDLAFVHAHARRRAEQRFPLEATLHAYRSGHKVISRWLRDAASAAVTPRHDARTAINAMTDFTMEYTDAISSAFAGTYSAHSLLLAEVAGDQRAQLLRLLLDGHDEADAHVGRVLRDAGFLEERQNFCVALAQSVDPTEMLDVERARRLADSIERIFAETSLRRLIDIRANKVIMVFADLRRMSGWTAPHTSLARRVSAALLAVGNAALIGVSNDVPSTTHIPAALREATAALQLASVSHRVLQFGDIALRHLLLHFAAEQFLRVLPGWSATYYEADRRAKGSLTGTLRAYANADMNILQAAHNLNVHPNTIYARLQRIQDISGLQPRSFTALNELLIVADCEPTMPVAR